MEAINLIKRQSTQIHQELAGYINSSEDDNDNWADNKFIEGRQQSLGGGDALQDQQQYKISTEKVHNIKYIKIIRGDERVTSDRLSHYDAVTAIGIRADQIEKSQDCRNYVDLQSFEVFKQTYSTIDFELDNSVKIAFVEFITRRSPLLLLKKLNNECFEEWQVREMQIPNLDNLNFKIFQK